jgi:hypothetical protein
MTNADGSPQQQPTTPVERPRYGEYLPAGSPPPYQAPPAYLAPQQPAPADYPESPYYQPVPPVRTRKVGDLVATCILLALGFFGMLGGIGIAAVLGPSLMQEYAKYGVTYSAPAALPTIATVIWVSHLVLFLAAVGGSIPLLVKRRIAFWGPLVAGVLAAIVFWGGLVALVAGDASLLDAIRAGQ